MRAIVSESAFLTVWRMFVCGKCENCSGLLLILTNKSNCYGVDNFNFMQNQQNYRALIV